MAMDSSMQSEKRSTDNLTTMKQEKKRRIFFIDPQSMRNLSVYDYWLQTRFTAEVFYFCSKHYDYRTHEHIKYKKVFGYNNIKFLPFKILSYILSYATILLWAFWKRPDIVHLQWSRIPKFDYYVFRFMKKALGIKIVHTAHNVLPLNHGERQKAIYGKIYDQADRIIVHTEKSKLEMMQIFGLPAEKIAVIRHGILKIDFDADAYEQEVESYDAKYQLNGKFVVIALGEQSYYKGTDILIKSWANTPELRDNHNCKLVCVGKAVYMDFSPLNGISNAIHDDRKISNEEFVYLLRHANLYILPYRFISQSGALMTALSEHIPVLVAEVGGLTDPLKVADVGWTLAHCDAETIAEKLTYLISHQEEVALKHDAETEWKKIDKVFGWDEISRSTQSLYDSL